MPQYVGLTGSTVGGQVETCERSTYTTIDDYRIQPKWDAKKYDLKTTTENTDNEEPVCHHI